MSLTSYQAAPPRDKDVMPQCRCWYEKEPAGFFDIMNRLIVVFALVSEDLAATYSPTP